MKPRTRWGGIVQGAFLGSLPGLAFGCVMDLLVNSAFIDSPLTFLVLACAVPGGVGGVLGAFVGARERGPLLDVMRLLGPAALIAALGVGDGVRPIPELKLLVVGLDGATWAQADPLVAKGELPALARFRAEGASGVLEASGPLFSPLLWTTIGTGKTYEEHGVHGFRVRSTDCKVPRFFDIAEHEGYRPGLYKWLVTWPPRELVHGGFIVPAWLARGPETTPSDLSFVKELELSRRLERQSIEARRSMAALVADALRHGVRWSTLRDAAFVLAKDRMRWLDPEERFRLMNQLRGEIDRDVFVHATQEHRPSVATFTYYGTDAIAHRFWRYHEPARFPDVTPAEVARFGEAVRDVYRQGDEILWEISRLVPPDARIIVLSDHGFEALAPEGGRVRVAPRTDTLEAELSRRIGPVQVARVGARAVVMLEGDDPAKQREAAETFLGGISGDGENALFSFEAPVNEPRTLILDLQSESAAALDVEAGLGQWVVAIENNSGDHNANGIFAALGPGVRRGAEVSLTQLDVAPVALAALGIPRGEDMRGRVPDGLWPEVGVVESWDRILPDVPLPKGASTDLGESEMLQELGYVDGR